MQGCGGPLVNSFLARHTCMQQGSSTAAVGRRTAISMWPCAASNQRVRAMQRGDCNQYGPSTHNQAAARRRDASKR